MQKQKGHVDGVFVIANVTSLSYGIDPASCVFDKDLMRWHLFQCLEAKRLTGFPAMDTN